MKEEEDTIGYMYAILVPNILTKSVRVTTDGDPKPLFYKRDEFIALVTKYGFWKIRPTLISCLSKTQSFLWKVEEDLVVPLTHKSETDSLLADLLAVKKEEENKVEELPLVEKFSRTEIDIDDPENPTFKLF